MCRRERFRLKIGALLFCDWGGGSFSEIATANIDATIDSSDLLNTRITVVVDFTSTEKRYL